MAHYASLEEDIEEEKNFYSAKNFPPKAELYSALLQEVGYDLICHAIEHFKEYVAKEWPSKTERKREIIEQFRINLGIGTEILLKSIIVKEKNDGSSIISTNPRYPNSTVSFKDSVIKIAEFLRKDKVDEKAIKRVIDVLNLIECRRNSIVHLGLRSSDSYRIPHQIFIVIQFLILKYFGEDGLTQELKKLAEINKNDVWTDYEPINFDAYL